MLGCKFIIWRLPKKYRIAFFNMPEVHFSVVSGYVLENPISGIPDKSLKEAVIYATPNLFHIMAKSHYKRRQTCFFLFPWLSGHSRVK